MLQTFRYFHMVKTYRGNNGKTKYDWFENHVKLRWNEAEGVSASSFADSLYIDVAQHLSAINRKMVAQGQIFRISNMRLWSHHTAEQLRFKVGIIPRTWMTRNSYVKAKALWDEMNALATTNVGGSSVYPKWHDFKVYMDTSHRLQPATDTPLPSDVDDNIVGSGEWLYSQYSDSGTVADNYYVHMLGDHTQQAGSDDNFTSVGIIQAYQESRVKLTAPLPLLPTTMDRSPWGRLFGDDDQTGDVFDRLESDNDMPPYHADNYVGATSMPQGIQIAVGTLPNLNNDKGIGAVRVPTFEAPLGLIRLEIDDVNAFDASTNGIEITFDVEILGRMDM